MAEKIVVEGAPRASRGKNEARRLRQTGKVPAVLYGGKGEAITLGGERQAGRRDSALRERAQHTVSGGPAAGSTNPPS